MRTLIFGAKGQLGRELIARFDDAGPVLGADLPEVDITDAAAVAELCDSFGPNLVINAAAFTDVDGAEENPEAAFAVNAHGAGNIATASARRSVPVVYYSTDFVFDGLATTPYPPDAPPAPLSVYGKSKAAGETATRAAQPRHCIIRTAWLYGLGGNNFVEKILRAAAARPMLRVVADEAGSPTNARDLAEATWALTRHGALGTFHAVNAGACSRYDFAREILSLAASSTLVEPCSAAEFKSKAARPRYAVLDCASMSKAAGYTMRPWQEALAAYMEEREGNP